MNHIIGRNGVSRKMPRKSCGFPCFAIELKNLTAEVAENAEAERAKCSALGCREKSGLLSNPSRKINTARGLSRNDLCDLCLLFVHPLVFILGGSKRKEESLSIKGFVFF